MNDTDFVTNKYGNFDNYLKYLLENYGHTKEQWNDYIKKTHTSEIQSKRGSYNTPEQQSLKGKKNTSEQQSIKGKLNTSEQQREKALKSAKVRFEGSNEQLKPWLDLGISRSYYYKQKKLGLI